MVCLGLGAVDRILELAAGGEFGDLASFDLYRAAGARIAADACCTLGDRKRTEPDQADSPALFEGLGNGVDGCGECGGCSGLGDLCLCRNRFDEFSPVHLWLLY